jgi:hypothetical protein
MVERSRGRVRGRRSYGDSIPRRHFARHPAGLHTPDSLPCGFQRTVQRRGSAACPGSSTAISVSVSISQQPIKRHRSLAPRLSKLILELNYEWLALRGGALGAQAGATGPTRHKAFWPQVLQRRVSMPVRLWSRPRQSVFGGFRRAGGPGTTPIAALQAAPLGLAWHPGRCPGLKNHDPLGRHDIDACAIHQHPRRLGTTLTPRLVNAQDEVQPDRNAGPKVRDP